MLLGGAGEGAGGAAPLGADELAPPLGADGLALPLAAAGGGLSLEPRQPASVSDSAAAAKTAGRRRGMERAAAAPTRSGLEVEDIQLLLVRSPPP
jgi:hypothetical protein